MKPTVYITDDELLMLMCLGYTTIGDGNTTFYQEQMHNVFIEMVED